MEHERVRSWLGLPPGSWPPDHYVLLGLAPGAGEYAEVEARVLDLMEKLRPHQLLYPDAVTEGMNRLAQALVCLTDPVARAAYDRANGFAPAVPFEVVEDEPPGPAPHDTRLAHPPGPPYEVVGPPEPDPLPYDAVEKVPPKMPYEVVPDEPGAKEPQPPPLPPYEVVPDEEKPPSPVEVVELPPPASRRELYRRLASVRKALRAWEKLRPVLANAAEPLATPVAVLLFLEALSEAREALPGVDGVIRRPGSPGGLVAALVRFPHALHALRTLLPTQRQMVASDWQHGYDALRREHARLRGLARGTRLRRGGVATHFLRVLRDTPEWILLVMGLALLLFALVRRNP